MACPRVSVHVWDLLTGALFSGKLPEARWWRGSASAPNPLRTMLGCNIALWSTMAVVAIQSSIVLLAVGALDAAPLTETAH